MKVLLIGNYRGLGQESMRRFSNLMLRGLTDRGVAAEIWIPPTILGRLAFGSQSIRKWFYYVDQYLLAPFSLWKRRRNFDLIHICDHSNALYGLVAGNSRWLVTCHDLLAVRVAKGEFPGVSTGTFGRILQALILGSLRKAPVVICDSTATFNDAVRLLKCTTQTIEVVPIAPNRIFHRRTEAETRLAFTRRNLGLLSNFFVHVGGTQWYKNRLGVLNIFAALREVETFARHDLIFVGKSLTQDIIDAVNALGLSDCVLSLETVDDDLLENLYSSATALLFPSFAEGFGWPIVEAQLCGCPVITSSSPPMSEVAGPESAILLDLAFPETHVRMICEGLRNKDYLVERGFENAARFDEKEMMSTYLKVYEKVISLQDSVSPLFGATRKE